MIRNIFSILVAVVFAAGCATQAPQGGRGFSAEPAKQPRLAESFAKDPESGAAIKLLNGGELGGVRILSRKTVDFMTSDHLGAIRGPGPGYGFGLGFAVRHADGLSSTNGSGGDYNWAGLGGTYFWVDPKERLIAVWMMQAPNQRNYYRELFRNMVYAALQ